MSAGTLSNIHETGADNQKCWFSNNNFHGLKVAVAFVSLHSNDSNELPFI